MRREHCGLYARAYTAVAVSSLSLSPSQDFSGFALSLDISQANFAIRLSSSPASRRESAKDHQFAFPCPSMLFLPLVQCRTIGPNAFTRIIPSLINRNQMEAKARKKLYFITPDFLEAEKKGIRGEIYIFFFFSEGWGKYLRDKIFISRVSLRGSRVSSLHDFAISSSNGRAERSRGKVFSGTLVYNSAIPDQYLSRLVDSPRAPISSRRAARNPPPLEFSLISPIRANYCRTVTHNLKATKLSLSLSLGTFDFQLGLTWMMRASKQAGEGG